MVAHSGATNIQEQRHGDGRETEPMDSFTEDHRVIVSKTEAGVLCLSSQTEDPEAVLFLLTLNPC